MQKEKGNGDLLTSWKEIAAYFGCDQRTCARWEKAFGLPVHRLAGAPKSRIFAYKHELDAWRHEKLDSGKRDVPPAPPHRAGRKTVRAILIILAVCGALVFLAASVLADRKPSDFRIEQSTFIVLNAKSRELWKYETGLDNLETDAAYKRALRTKRPEPDGKDFIPGFIWPRVLFEDIDQDGKSEVLFSTQTLNEFGEGDLICFDHRGKILWKYHAGRAMTYGGNLFSPDYRIDFFECEDLNNDGKAEIVVISSHNNDFPTQLAIMDCHGNIRGEYWNAGRIADSIFTDVNNDGKKEILVGGLNNEYLAACFFILDPDRVSGGSPQIDERFSCQGLAPGSELCYVIFPRTDFDVIQSPVEAIVEVSLLADNRIQLWMGTSRIYFELGLDLKLARIRNSHYFQQSRADAVRAGKLKGEADDAYFEALKKGLRYWTGKEWSSSPSWVSPTP